MSFFTFHGCFAGVLPPTPADPIVRGTPSFRAVTFCEPFRAASGYGWYTYPPLDFLVRWDGSSFRWMPSSSSNWLPLTQVPVRTLYRANQLEVSDDPVLDLPFLVSATEPGVLQIWTGLVAASTPDWALLVRSVPNLPIETTYEVQEGIIETAWWHGPLFGNIRFRRSDETVQFGRRRPLFALQPVRCESYQARMMRDMQFVAATADTRPHIGRLLSDALAVREEGSPGGYRREVSKRRRRASDTGPPGDGPAPTIDPDSTTGGACPVHHAPAPPQSAVTAPMNDQP